MVLAASAARSWPNWVSLRQLTMRGVAAANRRHLIFYVPSCIYLTLGLDRKQYADIIRLEIRDYRSDSMYLSKLTLKSPM